jgi:hypothetical protein
MKSIIQIIKGGDTQELIEYCYELENEVIENNQQVSSEILLIELVKEIYSSVTEIIEDDDNSKRFGETERVDFELSIKNLKKYMENFSRDNNFNLNY